MLGADVLPLVVFGVGTGIIIVAGTFLSRVADRLADATGLGEALVGALLLAGATSLPDFAATLSAAADERAELAMSNVMGSMAVNLAFLGVADLVYRKANLEHAAASASNLMLAALLVALLAIPLAAAVVRPLEVLGVHPATPLIAITYIGGLSLMRTAQTHPMWSPKPTRETITDTPRPEQGGASVPRLALAFAGLSALLAVAGWFLMDAAEAIADQTALSDSAVGGLFTAVATSSPELVTTIAAVRAGALTLALGNVIGTNCTNALVIAAADVAYRPGSIYHAMSDTQVLWGLMTILMTAVLLMGMLRRQTFGLVRIGFESVTLLVVYAGLAGSVLLTA